jgi:hypothetical protein
MCAVFVEANKVRADDLSAEDGTKWVVEMWQRHIIDARFPGRYTGE